MLPLDNDLPSKKFKFTKGTHFAKALATLIVNLPSFITRWVTRGPKDADSSAQPFKFPIVFLIEVKSAVDNPDVQMTSLEVSNRNMDCNRPNLTNSPHLSNFSSLSDRDKDG